MQRMAELMKKSACLVETQQATLPLACLGEIHDVNDYWLDISVELLLLAEGVHPGAAPFRGPRKIIADEKRDLAPVAIRHGPGSRIGMIKRYVLALAK